jgi:hypothetical protein
MHCSFIVLKTSCIVCVWIRFLKPNASLLARKG